MVGIESWNVSSFHRRPYSLEVLDWLFDIFLENEQKSLSLQGKQLPVFVTNNKIKTFKWILEFGETICHCELHIFLALKDIFEDNDVN